MAIPTNIKMVDMHLRDQRVLDWIRNEYETAGRVAIQISHSRVADEFSCHLNTAFKIIHRLVSSGNLFIEDSHATRGGYYYRPVEEKAA